MQEEKITVPPPPPIFSILYLDGMGKEISGSTPIEQVESVVLRVNVHALSDNETLGTALLKGFMQERAEEFDRLVRAVRLKRKGQPKVLTPGMAGLQLVH